MNKFVELGDRYFKFTSNFIFGLAIAIIVAQIMELGLENGEISKASQLIKPFYTIFGAISVLLSVYLFLSTKNIYVRIARAAFVILAVIFLVISIISLIGAFIYVFDASSLSQFLAVLIGFMSISFKISGLGNSDIHPAVLFVLSFIFLILFGAFCLMLPAASNTSVTFIQALFTATSAVTVTGLAVLDTGKDYTLFGQTIILILIQLGGLGVLTVTNIFALIFKSSNTFKNRMMVGDMIKEFDNKNTFRTLFKIIMFTVGVEMVGAILIYFCIFSTQNLGSDRIFFSVFHAVSAFCNGGFSTLSNSLYEENVRFNYNLHLVISWLIFTGGLGYSVMINHYSHIKHWVRHKISVFIPYKVGSKKEFVKTTTNNRLILWTTSSLLLFGAILFFIAEYNGVLQGHSLWGKMAVSIFNSMTPRTAGFNNVDMAALGIPSIMLIMALMWIGASPGSTGGGIKTTTFAVALLNLVNQIKGKDRIIVNNREIPPIAINQINAVILLSIFAISFSTFMLSIFDPTFLFKDLLFESISAYSTVGLSVGITPKLTPASHIVLVVVMFLGRVSFLTFLIGLFSQIFRENYTSEPYYPKENVFIN